jgi:predicted amidophosphoribosyltransferase
MEHHSAGYAICRLCDGPTQEEYRLCYCCTTLVRQLRMPLAPVVAITPYRLGDEMHRLLRGYKDAPVADQRTAHTARLADILRRWLDVNADSLRLRFGSRWDTVVTVPSSHRPSGAPVDGLVATVPTLARLRRRVLVRGPEATDHLMASARGFTVRSGSATRDGPGGRALVIDDSFTTGARAQSAVAVLRQAGIGVAGVLVVGRVVAPDAAPWQAAYWDATGAERALAHGRLC